MSNTTNRARPLLGIKLGQSNTGITNKKVIVISKKRSGSKKDFDVAGFLSRTFPKCFVKGRVLPLKLNIINDLKDHPKIKGIISTKRLRAYLYYYTHSNKYYNTIIKLKHRYGLKGEKANIITAEHKKYSRLQLSKKKQPLKKDMMRVNLKKEAAKVK